MKERRYRERKRGKLKPVVGMRRGKVALEPGLDPVREELLRRGFEIADLEGDLRGVRAVVVRGTDENTLGWQSPLTPAPVIRAAGRTPREVADEVERRLLPS